MKKLLLAAAVLVGVANFSAKAFSIPASVVADNTPAWADAFLMLQNAIAKGDKATIKKFITFPFTTLTPDMAEEEYAVNHIWLAVNGGMSDENRDEKLPFTAQDFDTYFDALFGENHRKAVAALKLEDLVKHESSEYKILATGDKQEGAFHSAIAYLTPEENKLSIFFITGEIMCDTESPNECQEFGSGYGFTFQIKGKDLVLVNIDLAG